LDVVPVQLVWARVATVDAESNAITAVVVSKCVRIDASHFEQTFCCLKIGVKDVSAWPRRF
jgi:hypothetical protein